MYIQVGDRFTHELWGEVVVKEVYPSKWKGKKCLVGKRYLIEYCRTDNTQVVDRSNLVKGTYKDYTQPTVYGLGIPGHRGARSKNTREYDLWRSMVHRASQTEGPYSDVTLSDRWVYFANFLQDLPLVKGYKSWEEGKKVHLDKDTEVPGNREYSLAKVAFVPKVVNERDGLQKAHLAIRKPVVHLPTGRYYESAAMAAKDFGLKTQAIALHCRGKRKTQLFAYEGDFKRGKHLKNYK